MSEGEIQAVVHTFEVRFGELRADVNASLAAFREEAREDRRVRREEMGKVYERLNGLPFQAHAVKLEEMETFRRQFWPKVLGAAGFVWAVFMWLFSLLRGSVK